MRTDITHFYGDQYELVVEVENGKVYECGSTNSILSLACSIIEQIGRNTWLRPVVVSYITSELPWIKDEIENAREP